MFWDVKCVCICSPTSCNRAPVHSAKAIAPCQLLRGIVDVHFVVAVNFAAIFIAWRTPSNSGSMLPATSESFVSRRESSVGSVNCSTARIAARPSPLRNAVRPRASRVGRDALASKAPRVAREGCCGMNVPLPLKRAVFQRAGGRCEYCGLSQAGQEAQFHVDRPARQDHRQNHGSAVILSCSCNGRGQRQIT